MKVILAMVQTVNGKITRGDDPDIYKWTSREDQEFFFSLRNKHKLIVMGSRTYEAAKHNIKLDNKRLRIVLTSTPKRYTKQEVEGSIEFSSLSPKPLIKNLNKRGFSTMLLVGGGEINKSFLKERLVDEVFLTVEPWIFGKGKCVISEGDFEQELKLIDMKQLNNKGTLLLHYKLVRK